MVISKIDITHTYTHKHTYTHTHIYTHTHTHINSNSFGFVKYFVARVLWICYTLFNSRIHTGAFLPRRCYTLVIVGLWEVYGLLLLRCCFAQFDAENESNKLFFGLDRWIDFNIYRDR